MMAELGLSPASQLKRPTGTCGPDPTVGCWAQWAGAGQPESLGQLLSLELLWPVVLCLSVLPEQTSQHPPNTLPLSPHPWPP